MKLASYPVDTATNTDMSGGAKLPFSSTARFPRTKLPPAVMPFIEAAKNLIARTFPGDSVSAIARRAVNEAPHIFNSTKTVERILNGETKRLDAQMVFAILTVFHAKFGEAYPIGGGYEVAIFQRVQE